MVLGGDVARRSSFVAYAGLSGMAYLPSRFIPRVRQHLGEEATRTLLVDHPAQWVGVPGDHVV